MSIDRSIGASDRHAGDGNSRGVARDASRGARAPSAPRHPKSSRHAAPPQSQRDARESDSPGPGCPATRAVFRVPTLAYVSDPRRSCQCLLLYRFDAAPISVPRCAQSGGRSRAHCKKARHVETVGNAAATARPDSATTRRHDRRDGCSVVLRSDQPQPVLAQGPC